MESRFGRPAAIACLRGDGENPCLTGAVRFYPQSCGRVLVEVSVSGLPQESDTGFFALHIHEGKGCGGADFVDTGAHFNPKNTGHPGHAGDLPPLLSNRGDAYLTVMTDRFCVQDVLGRTVVIHDRRDDFTSQPAGNAGRKIACGVICGR